MKFLTRILVAGSALLLPISSFAAPGEADDCSLVFQGKDRAAVKNRTSATNYTKANHGQPMTIAQLFAFNTSLAKNIPKPPAGKPAKSVFSQTAPMKGIEDVEVTVRGYLLGMKWEKEEDQDFHVEVAGAKNWGSPHIVIEVPPGQAFCQARKAVWALVKKDAKDAGQHPPTTHHSFAKPPYVEFKGYLFVDAIHGGGSSKVAWTVSNGGRGIREDGTGKKWSTSKVRGLFEVHPVTSLKKISEPGG